MRGERGRRRGGGIAHVFLWVFDESSGLYALLPRRLLLRPSSRLCASACPSPRPPVPRRTARSCRAGGGGGAEACRPSDTWRRWRAASRWRRWPSQGRPTGADGGSEGPRHTIRARLQGMPPALQPASPCRRPAVLPSRPRLALSCATELLLPVAGAVRDGAGPAARLVQEPAGALGASPPRLLRPAR